MKRLKAVLPKQLPAVLYLALVILVATYSARQSISGFLVKMAATRGSVLTAMRAVQVDPGDPDAHRTLGVLLLKSGEPNGAVMAFERAVAIKENDFHLWILLGSARSQSGDISGAEQAFLRSISLAPTYSRPKYSYGKMLLGTGRPELAFQYLSRSAQDDIGLYAEILSLAANQYPGDPGAVQNAATPYSVEARKFLARYFIRNSMMTEEIRSFLLGGDLSDTEKHALVDDLIDRHDFRLAHEVWASSTNRAGADTTQPIFDGGFEKINGSDEGQFGWQVDQNISGTSISRTQEKVRAGTYAVEIKFAGKAEIGRRILSQVVFLEPNRNYRMKFFYRSSEMVTAGPPSIVITDRISDRELGRSKAIGSTDNRWTEAQVDFTTAETPAVMISLVRAPCGGEPCPIFGELALDEFTLAERQPR